VVFCWGFYDLFRGKSLRGWFEASLEVFMWVTEDGEGNKRGSSTHIKDLTGRGEKKSSRRG